LKKTLKTLKKPWTRKTLENPNTLKKAQKLKNKKVLVKASRAKISYLKPERSEGFKYEILAREALTSLQPYDFALPDYMSQSRGFSVDPFAFSTWCTLWKLNPGDSGVLIGLAKS
jgi:hypothetical protein